MPKRKRGDDAGQSLTEKILLRQQQEVYHVFLQSTKQLTRAFKLAKGFERQKLGRRQRRAVEGKEQDTMQRIRLETASLKALENSSAAQHYLSKTLLKIPPIATSPAFHPEIGKLPELPTDTATLNVHARLCDSNPVKEALPAAIDVIRRELGIKEEVQPMGKKKRLRASDYKAAEAGDAGGKLGRGEAPRSASPMARHGASRVDKQLANGFDDSDDEMEPYRGRLASSDDEDADSTLDVVEIERQLEDEGIACTLPTSKPPPYSHAADLSLSDDASDQDRDTPEPRKAPATKKSAFLPSLTLAGYISGSGSDLDDDLDAAPKKNRRGQRARQAIWEQKYGVKAKHLQKEDRSKGWDAKRGAMEMRGRGGGRGGVGRGGAARGGMRGGASSARPPPPRQQRANLVYDAKKPMRDGEAKKPVRDDSGPLHPSWEAAKRAKEKKSVPVVFAGKKISFE